MTYLVDANVLSEPTKLAPHPKAVAWLSDHEGDFVVDPIVLGEIDIGILALPRGRKRILLERWFQTLTETIDCLPWDLAVSRCWAKLVVDLRKKGISMPILDGMISATALEHGLAVVTRNVRDFRKAGVKVVDPFV
jgi:hypothetical protein